MSVKDGCVVSQVFAAISQRHLHLSFVRADMKEFGFDALDITSKVSLRINQAVTLCDEAGEGGDGNGGTVGDGQGHLEEGGREGERAFGFSWVENQDHPHRLWETLVAQFAQHIFVPDLAPPTPEPKLLSLSGKEVACQALIWRLHIPL